MRVPGKTAPGSPPMSKEEGFDRLIAPLIAKIRAHCDALDIPILIACELTEDRKGAQVMLVLECDLPGDADPMLRDSHDAISEALETVN